MGVSKNGGSSKTFQTGNSDWEMIFFTLMNHTDSNRLGRRLGVLSVLSSPGRLRQSVASCQDSIGAKNPESNVSVKSWKSPKFQQIPYF